MDKKNTMLLTVIAVATLLVAVVGATFAYYSVTTTNQSSTRTVTTTTPPLATVTLTQGSDNLYLNITGDQMADNSTARRTYYHTTTNVDAVTTASETTVATFAVSGADANTTFSCKFDYSVSTANAPADLAAGDAFITLAVDNASGSTVSFTNFPPSQIDLSTTTSSAVSGTGQLQVTGDTSTIVTALAEFDTDNREQSDIANTTGMVTTVTINNLRCLTGTTYPS